MVRTRRTGVHLHSGNPEPKVLVPRWGAKDVKGSGTWHPELGPQLPQRPKPHKPKKAPQCGWCGSTSKVTVDEAVRCKRCRTLELTVEAAKRFLAVHALRQLGGSTESDSPTELEHRRAARVAQRTLASVKAPAKPPRAPSPASTGKGTKATKKTGRRKSVRQPKYL